MLRPSAQRVYRHRRPAFCNRARSAASRCCTTKRKNAHSTEFRELLYPWHPWSGLRVVVHAAIERPGGVVFRCDLKASESGAEAGDSGVDV